MSEIFEELRVIAEDVKGLNGHDRRVLIQVAERYEQMCKELAVAKTQKAMPQPAALPQLVQPTVPLPEPLAVTQFNVFHTGNTVQLQCLRARLSSNPADFTKAVLTFDPVASLLMSPQAAKDLSLLLADNIGKYEHDYGPLVTDLTKSAGMGKP